MRAKGGSPNLINGVSRQPAEVRLTSQLEESINQFPTVSRGLVPRNPAVLKGVVSGPRPANSTVHLIDRDDDEQYVVTISPNGIEVHDLDGTAKTVSAPNGLGYLAGAGEGDLEALTVADHTFILNKKKTVQASSAKSPQFVNGGLIHIASGDYHTEYSILVDGVVRAKVMTDGGPYSQESDARAAEKGARPANIAHLLLNGTPLPNVVAIPANAQSHLKGTLGTSGWTYQLMDNVIYIQRNSTSNFRLDVKAGSETRARAHKGASQDFSELPRRAPHNFSIKVSGSEDTNYDDYYVRFDHPNEAAQGRWKETIGPDVPYRIDPATMPHVLVRNANGTFTFKQAEWADREVGDLETNPWPSFVNRTIDGMVFFKNRIGFISGESVSMSRHGAFFNFFIESILTPLDTDPIDISISYPEISNIHHAVPFAGEMVLFTSSVPFRLAGGDTFTPTNVFIDHLLSNDVSKSVRPVTAGNKLYFVNDAPSGCFVHEFVYDREVGVKEAPAITDHVHGYIPSGVTMMDADEDLNMIVMVSPNDPKTIYFYKWLWIGREKAQSAWQKWVLPHPVIGLKFFGEELVVVTAQDTTREVLSINCHEAQKPYLPGYHPVHVYLDRLTKTSSASMTYDPQTDRTWVPTPLYTAPDLTVFRAGQNTFGRMPEIVERRPDGVYVRGDITSEWVWIGVPYESYGVLSPLLHRPTNNQGAYGNATPGVTTTIGNLILETGPSAFLKIELERAYRKNHTYEFSAALVGTKTGRLGEVVLGEIRKPASIMAKSDDVEIKFGGIGPYPYAVLAYEWSGSATPSSY